MFSDKWCAKGFPIEERDHLRKWITFNGLLPAVVQQQNEAVDGNAQEESLF